MASANLHDELTCCICLHIYNDPVTLQCGHSFCQECIERALDTQRQSIAYTCPQCRTQFWQHPVLQRNTTLCNIVELFLSQEEKEADEVYCTYCDNTPVVSSKTCLLCKVSMCEHHLAAHSKSPEHVLIQPTNSISNRMCSPHKKVFMYYCTEDAECLCVSCCLGEKHRGHKVELLNDASKKKKEKLRIIQDQIKEERKEFANRVQSLQDHLRHIPHRAAGMKDRLRLRLVDLQMKVDVMVGHTMNELDKQQEQVSLSVSDLIQQLESMDNSLSSNVSAIEDLCQMTDPVLVLQADGDDFADVMGENVKKLKEMEAPDLDEDLINQVLDVGLVHISGQNSGYYVQQASHTLLDVNTASNDVHLSEDLRTATWTAVNQGRPKTPERFVIRRVLGTKGFSMVRIYWDLEGSKEGGWRIGLTYPSIERKGKHSLIGNNKKSWGLRSHNKQYSVRHNQKEIPLACRPSCYKVRIYLDYTAGLLSFFELGDSMKHLYTYSTTFTEALYPVIVVWNNAWVRVLT